MQEPAIKETPKKGRVKKVTEAKTKRINQLVIRKHTSHKRDKAIQENQKHGSDRNY